MSASNTLPEIIRELNMSHIAQASTTSAQQESLAWPEDPAILSYLESLEPKNRTAGQFRFQVQSIHPPDAETPGIAGILAGGTVTEGDEVMVAASLKRSRIKRVSGSTDDTLMLVLEDDIDIRQGDVLHRPGETLEHSNQFQAHLVWMSSDPMLPERSYLLKIGTQSTSVQVTDLKYAMNIESGEHLPATKLDLHDIGICNFATAKAIAFDTYAENARTGSFILIDRISNHTVAAGMLDFGLHRGQNLSWQSFEINRDLRAGMKDQKPVIVWFTGLSASGKSSIADIVEQKLAAQNRHTYLLDGDNFRHGLNKDLGFTDADRVENIRRVAEVARLMADSGLIVMTAFISPFRRERRMAREIAGDIDFIEVFVDTPLEICEARDPKGMYAKARRGEIPNFTGISSAYESPENADIHLHAGDRTAEELADEVLQKLQLSS